MLRAENQVVGKDIGRESDDSNSEAREDISEHYARLEDRALTPSIPLSPRISKKWEIGHGKLTLAMVLRRL